VTQRSRLRVTAERDAYREVLRCLAWGKRHEDGRRSPYPAPEAQQLAQEVLAKHGINEGTQKCDPDDVQ
jgi:hypothetical protein